MAGSGAQVAALPEATLWKIRIAAILWALLIIGCLLALPVMFDATAVLVVLAIVLAVLLGAAFAWLYRRFAGPVHGFLHDWLKFALATFCVLCILCAAPIYFMAVKAETDPALLPRAVLTNGEKTVVYQGMMHIGSEPFYKQVVYDAEQALSDGYVLYYEGVQPNPAGDKWFSDNLAGGGDLSANYKMLGETCGLQFQLDYFGMLQKDMKEHPDRHVAADVDTLDMQNEFERLMKTDPTFAAGYAKERAAEAEAGSTEVGAVNVAETLTPDQKKLSGYVCRYMMSNIAKGGSDPRQIEKIILDFRNRKLVERIVSDPHDKIYITYGANHLKGIIPLLQKADPRWTVESVTWIRPLQSPKSYEGEI
ncbi:hypothetical protein GRI89_06040 [Altererythrobacter salegens]|uniref:TraB family protein n=1 Tax=Croceibacterium salegens TaxID=1737568 RepID=A0A6I4SUI8_9SPHN|nr:hypothetical protein [Croceibacterium salegens]MXO59099.1 hypothetical protein [Croceibacterium salegens]